MNNLVILPIIIPIIAGMIMVIFRENLILQRFLSVFSTIAISVATLLLIIQISSKGIQTLYLGGWEAPFGVSMVADMFSAILILVTSIVSLCCLLFAFNSIGRERESYYFYPLFLFLITGVNGSFLTGDIFNLFVFFEVMLVASYVLISLGSTRTQLRESIKYILINIISSFLFLVAIAFLYAMTGTLNFAHLSLRVAEVGQEGLMTTVALLFLIVFSLKAGLFLFFWLPGSYSAPPTAISAIFAALLTKVGIYAIMRVFTLVFYHRPEVTHLFIGILAAVTMLLGAIGAVAFWDIKRILTYNVIVGVGFILAGVASFTTEGMTGSLYYLIHDMIIKALIFLLGGTIVHLTGTSKLKEISGLIRLHPGLGWMFFIAALSLSGIPPLSGFLGKIFISEGTFKTGYFWLGGIGLITSLMVLYSIMKIFINGFWGHTDLTEEKEKGTTKGLLLPIGILTILTIALGLGTEGIHGYVDIAVEGLMNPSQYIEAVLGSNPAQ
ncbi:Na+/H+ antiporter subunit D [Neobacillus vireti]|uniref:Monovalent cation/H+ antiporter subunit D n=1 Tax=Neobacillus vireti LMG 21834 TaxID=1131730 RepID=A0AB94INW7_9BACI|nr:Na+/H+ antiporter subunit D [Neobacillus vireti]ETI68776.1 monovalent cation/H+ antiporter subunit D [Neobacillus vireti LMG 21834]KLT18757.1 monovalent cation/H+ antiporter subunit D [Neobacillus vireti]